MPVSCCVATSRLPHRRVPTLAAAQARVVLNVDFTTCSAAKLQAIGVVDEKAFEAASSGGIVGRTVRVDDMHGGGCASSDTAYLSVPYTEGCTSGHSVYQSDR